jgi:membrane protein
MVFALATFGLMAFGRWGSGWFSGEVGTWRFSHGVWEAGRWLVTLMVMCIAVDLANYFLPDGNRPWRWLTPGTAFVVLTLVGSSAGFNVYVQHFASYPRIYGALGGFIILMLWIYITFLILLVGAETDHEMEKSDAETRVG